MHVETTGVGRRWRWRTCLRGEAADTEKISDQVSVQKVSKIRQDNSGIVRKVKTYDEPKQSENHSLFPYERCTFLSGCNKLGRSGDTVAGQVL
jgi:hypothetical protein